MAGVLLGDEGVESEADGDAVAMGDADEEKEE